MKHKLALIWIGCSLAWSQTGAFREETFSAPWTATRIGSQEGTATQRLSGQISGGNPGAYGVVAISLSTGTSGGGGYPNYYYPPAQPTDGAAWFFFTRNDLQFSPGGTDPVLAIDQQEDFQHLSHSCSGCSDSVTSYVALRQNGVVYVARKKDWRIGPGWQANVQTGIRPDEFVEFGRSFARPNFGPQGGPIEVGFVRGFTGAGSIEIVTAIDNWSFTVRRLRDLGARNDRYMVFGGNGARFVATADIGLLTNDAIDANQGFQAVLVQAPRGNLVLNQDGGFTYTAPTTGTTDEFTYKLRLGEVESPTARVQLAIARMPVACSIEKRKTERSGFGVITTWTESYYINVFLPPGKETLLGSTGRFRYLDEGGLDLASEVRVGLFGDLHQQIIPYKRFDALKRVELTVDGTDTKCSIATDRFDGDAVRQESVCPIFYLVNDFAVSLRTYLNETFGLFTMRGYRDQILMKNQKVSHYRDLYYRHAAEVTGILKANPILALEAAQLLVPMQEAAQSVLLGAAPQDAEGLERKISAMIEALLPHASKPLRSDLIQFQSDLHSVETRRALGLEMERVDLVAAAVSDAEGNVYQAGSNGTDAFLKKLEVGTQRVLFVKYFGGKNLDVALGLAFDRNGNLVLTGLTQSDDFPLEGAVQSRYGGDGPGALLKGDAFVTVLDRTAGKILFSTYLGGESFDAARGVAADRSGMIYVAGVTQSKRFPVREALKAALTGDSDGWVAKIDPVTRSIVYSTYFGGAGDDAVGAIAVDASGNLHLAGAATAMGIPLAQAAQWRLQGPSDAIVAKLNPAGTALVYSTYFGGSGIDTATTLTLASNGNLTVGGAGTVDTKTLGWLAEFGPTGKLLQSKYLEGEDGGLPLHIVGNGNTLEVAGVRLNETLQASPYLSSRRSDLEQLGTNPRLLTPGVGFATTVTADSKGNRTASGVIQTDEVTGFTNAVPDAAPEQLRFRRGSTRFRLDAIAPGSIVVVDGFTMAGLTATVTPDSGAPADELGTVRVRFGEASFGLLHSVQERELVVATPMDLALGLTPVSIERAGVVVAKGMILVETSAPQLFSTDGKNLGPALASWSVDEETGTRRLTLFASGLRQTTEPVLKLQIVGSTGTEIIGIEKRTLVGGYVGLEQLETAAVPEKTFAGGTVSLYLSDGGRYSNGVTARLP